jgi:type I restriction enzyme S subunit
MDDIAGEAHGSTMRHIKRTDLLPFQVPVPPLDEQRRIATILDASEATIRATEAVIEKLRLEREGLLVESIESLWKSALIRRLADLTTSHDAGIYIDKSLYGSGHNIIGVGDLFRHASIDGQVFSRAQVQPHEVNAYTLREGDLLYAESSLVLEGIAKTLHVTSAGAGTLFAWHTRRLRLNKAVVDPFYAALALSAPTCRRFIMSRATQTALTGMPVAAYLETPMPVPELARQREISDLARSSDQSMHAANAQLTKLRLQHQGLLHDLLTGAVRTHV